MDRDEVYKIGAPGVYLDNYPELLKKIYMLNHKATLDEVAEFFRAKVSTIKVWREKYPEFATAREIGSKYSDLEVLDSLHYLATKHTKKTKKVFCYKGEIVEAEYDEEMEPEAGAIGTWFSIHGIGKEDQETNVKIVVTQEAQAAANAWLTTPKSKKSMSDSAQSKPAKFFDPLEGL